MNINPNNESCSLFSVLCSLFSVLILPHSQHKNPFAGAIMYEDHFVVDSTPFLQFFVQELHPSVPQQPEEL